MEFIGSLLCQRQEHLDSLHNGLIHLLTGTFLNAWWKPCGAHTPVAGAEASSVSSAALGKPRGLLSPGRACLAWHNLHSSHFQDFLNYIYKLLNKLGFLKECFYLWPFYHFVAVRADWNSTFNTWDVPVGQWQKSFSSQIWVIQFESIWISTMKLLKAVFFTMTLPFKHTFILSCLADAVLAVCKSILLLLWTVTVFYKQSV